MYHVYCSTSPTHFFPRVPEDMTFCLRLLPIKHLTSCMSGLGRNTGKVFTIVTALLIWFVLSDNLTKPHCEGLHWGKAYVLYLGHFLQWMREVQLPLSLLDMGPFPWCHSTLAAVNSVASKEGLHQLVWVCFFF